MTTKRRVSQRHAPCSALSTRLIVTCDVIGERSERHRPRKTFLSLCVWLYGVCLGPLARGGEPSNINHLCLLVKLSSPCRAAGSLVRCCSQTRVMYVIFIHSVRPRTILLIRLYIVHRGEYGGPRPGTYILPLPPVSYLKMSAYACIWKQTPLFFISESGGPAARYIK